MNEPRAVGVVLIIVNNEEAIELLSEVLFTLLTLILLAIPT